ncbi:MAG TPA: glycosyltransferase family 2 protein [Chitinophagaceae bacterium]|nr:glycosyltransferase family 2 protein [Chitinophagaceae bacterium]
MTPPKPAPLISIITVCFNARRHIEALLDNVALQTYPALEHILVDGGSTDGTLEIIRNRMAQVGTLISEPDQGLYDAMNKGMAAARGEYLFFLNADDELESPDTLERALAQMPGADGYYGEVMFMDGSGKPLGLRSTRTPQRVPEQLSWKSLRRGMVVSHQAFIVRRSLAPPFDLRYRVASDIDWMIRCLKSCKTLCNTHQVITRFRTGGLSKAKQRLAWRERFLILSRHFGFWPNLVDHGIIILRYFRNPRY